LTEYAILPQNEMLCPSRRVERAAAETTQAKNATRGFDAWVVRGRCQIFF